MMKEQPGSMKIMATALEGREKFHIYIFLKIGSIEINHEKYERTSKYW